ncbi:periplasmic heavy metal sensor [Trinickia sp. NRRL B-1857]|uniref:periplasmic heavy metal sensor n=1 Tax=Trinickia sp. NRRL B-1857 TaxID=3162879 RepID=UPI003D283C96
MKRLSRLLSATAHTPQTNPTSRLSRRWLAVSAAAVVLGLGTAYAAENAPGPAGDTGGWHHGWHGHHHDDGMMIMKELGKLHNELKLTLTPAQERLWQNALQTMTQARDAARTEHDAARKQFEAMAQQPVIDLDAMHNAHQKLADDQRQRHEQVTAAWLKVYDSLSEQQKKVVSDDIKQHLARMAHRGGWMMEHGHDAAPGAAPSQTQ